MSLLPACAQRTGHVLFRDIADTADTAGVGNIIYMDYGMEEAYGDQGEKNGKQTSDNPSDKLFFVLSLFKNGIPALQHMLRQIFGKGVHGNHAVVYAGDNDTGRIEVFHGFLLSAAASRNKTGTAAAADSINFCCSFCEPVHRFSASGLSDGL